ncbi:MAG: helix-turn-helix transcriptional regulator [Polyangiaceae bacterium]
MKGKLPAPAGLACSTLVIADEEFLLLEFPLPRYHAPAGLTPSEAAVTELLVGGNSVKQIALLRGTSENTVRNQIRAIHKKLGVADVGELAKLCFTDPGAHGRDVADVGTE